MAENAPSSEAGTPLDARAKKAARNWWQTLPDNKRDAIKREHFEKEVPMKDWKRWIDAPPLGG